MLQFAILGPVLLLAAPPVPGGDEGLAARLRALSAIGTAEVPRPSRDGSRLLFVTSLFGSRQLAVIPIDGGYPVQLTSEREGVIAGRYSPTDPRQVVAIVRRDGRRRVVLLDDQGSPPAELDKSPGDQLFGGFTRDGKRAFFATFAEGKARLFQFQLEGNKATEVLPGTTGPASGVIPPPYTPPPPRDAGVADAGTGTGTGAGAGSRSSGGAPSISALSDVLPDATALGPPS